MLFGSRWYTLGVLIAMAGWGTHVGALALAPISLVQATIAGGLVMLTVIADRFFAHQVTRREWIGVALAAAGLAFLAATLDGGADEAHSDYESLTLAVVRRGRDRRRDRDRRARALGPAGGRPVRRLRRDALGRLGHDDQGPQRLPRRGQRRRDRVQPDGAADPAALARGDCSSRPAAFRSARWCP